MNIYSDIDEKRALQQWYEDDGEELRLDYPLQPRDLVLDLGGHLGDWAGDILARRPDVRVWIFEPVAEHVARLQGRFEDNPCVRVIDAAAAAADGSAPMVVRGTGSTLCGRSPNMVDVNTVDLARFLKDEAVDDVALVKINIEGGEYDLLDHLISMGVITTFKNLQVQFHDIAKDSKHRRDNLRDRLQQTHELTYDYPFVWENWARRS